MSDAPKFEREPEHEFKVDEDIYMIDPNGFDIWKAKIVSIEGLHFSIHYPEYPDDDETVTDKDRILPLNRINTRIYNQQEAARASNIGLDSEEDYEEEAEADGDEDGPDYKPAAPLPEDIKIKGKRGRKPKEEELGGGGPRPENARSNPPRSSKRLNTEYSDESNDDEDYDE